MQPKILAEVSSIVDSYKKDEIEITEGLKFSMYNTIKTIDYYSSSQYLNGNTDNVGREKPFYNVVNQKVVTAKVKTDLDIKDIQIISDDPNDSDKSFLLSHESYEWMKDANFSKCLNDMGETATRYGGVLVKKCIEVGDDEDDRTEELEVSVVPWNRVTVNPTNIEGGIKITENYMTPVDLAKKADVWDNTTELIKAYSKIKKGESYLNNAITVYDVEGEFPESFFEEGGSDDKFKLYHAIIGGDKKGKQYVMFYEEKKKSDYKFFRYGRTVAGRDLGVGEVEEGFESQVWSNDSVINEKNAMELAGKVVLKTNSKKIGGNILTDIDNGHVFEMEDGKDLTSLNLMPSALPEFQNQLNKWKDQYDRVTSVYEANTGENLPSGTPFRLAAMLSQEANTPFDYKREQMGIFLTEIFEDWVIPYLVKRLSDPHILTSDFSQDELKKIDESFVVSLANEEVIKAALSGKISTQQEYDAFIDQAKQQLSDKQKSRRFLEVPKDYFKGINSKVTVLTTGEQRNKAAALDSLNSIMVSVSQNPAVMQDPILRKVFARIVELAGAGISSFEIMSEKPTQIPGPNGVVPQAGGQAAAPANPLQASPANVQPNVK